MVQIEFLILEVWKKIKKNIFFKYFDTQEFKVLDIQRFANTIPKYGEYAKISISNWSIKKLWITKYANITLHKVYQNISR